ncbi:MAG: penicillin acylase family protein [Marmoricola sp.]
MGSNAWAVTGSLTTSGKPLLANDPHLSVSLPGTFWQVGAPLRDGDNRVPL